MQQTIPLQNTYTKLPSIFYTKQCPSSVPNPNIAVFNASLAKKLGLDPIFFTSKEGVEILAGNDILMESKPIAQAYAGHQFGYFNRLGDGRAVLLGEYECLDGELLDIQLKGSGVTPYSRGGDGKATLGPMLREYIISEAMEALKIPTTRSLAVLSTGETILRDEPLPGAILVRLAKSHIRVGTFQYAARFGTIEDLKTLADYTIARHFSKEKEVSYLQFLQQVIHRQAQLLAKWQLVGFVHGVMNTDNMTISGETIDYGPCAFMDEYNPEIVFSFIDTEGRYAYKNQPKMAAWNLARFAETLLPLLHEEEKEAIRIATEEISKFGRLYTKYWEEGMKQKLGLKGQSEMDEPLIEALLGMMQKYKADYTNTFRDLTLGNYEEMELAKAKEFPDWLALLKQRIINSGQTMQQARESMKQVNPTVIPRNHLVEEALEAAVKRQEYDLLHTLLTSVTTPYDYTKKENLAAGAPKMEKRYVTYCGT